MVKFKLNHTCNLADAKGVAGDVILVTEKRAAWLVERKGGEIVQEAAPEAVKPAAKKPADETVEGQTAAGEAEGETSETKKASGKKSNK